MGNKTYNGLIISLPLEGWFILLDFLINCTVLPKGDKMLKRGVVWECWSMPNKWARQRKGIT